MDVRENNYRFEKVNQERISDLIYISKSAFNIVPAADYYLNKNNTSKFGDPYLGFIAYSSDGQPAAFYGVYACEVVIDDKVYKVVQSGDTMTHKDHMGKGLFTKLAQMTYDLCRELGYHFVYGFPNYNSYPGFVKKLNWICPDKMREYRFKTITIPLLKIAKKVSFFNTIYNIYLKFINSFFKPNSNYFNSSVLENGIGGVNRSNDFIDYKIKSGNTFVVSLAGSKVWMKPDGFLIVGDIEVKDNFNIEKLVKSLKFYAFLIGADVIIFQTTPKTKLDKEFSKIAESKEAFPYGWCSFSNEVDPSKFAYVFADVDTF
jgi:hypothetical protein